MLLVLFCIAFISFSFSQNEKFNIIRARGIVIEDKEGKDRILIGAPAPYSPNRVRTDTAMVRKHWASRFKDPDEYMKWYANYRHNTTGIIVMNDKGFDRVLLGDQLADANGGKRMFEAAGIIWNDKDGFERGGAGVNTTEEGESRAVIGLDDKEGEAIHIVTLEDGTKGLFIRGAEGSLLVGMSKKNGQWFKNKNAFAGIKYFNSNDSLLWEVSTSGEFISK